MSSVPDRQAASHYQAARASEIEGLADGFVAFVEEYEAALSKGRVPPAFVERLAQLLKSAERLI